MSLSIKEKVGAVVAFIPLVSTISGLIKAFVYYNRVKKASHNLLERNIVVTKVHTEGIKQLSDLEVECYNKLWKASIAEMIPLFNVIAAIYSAVVLNELSEIRERIQDPERNLKTIFQTNGVNSFKDPEKDTLMFEVIELLKENEKHLIPFCQGLILGLKKPCSAGKLVKFAREEFKKSENNTSSTCEEPKDILRAMEEQSKQRAKDLQSGKIQIEID